MCGVEDDMRPSVVRFHAAAVTALALVVLFAAPLRASDPAAHAVSPGVILDRMEERWERQVRTLAVLRDQRRYTVNHPLLGDSTYLLVEERFRAPEDRAFSIIERGGPSAVQSRVFLRLLDVERETTPEAARRAVDICRRNYDFTFAGYDAAAEAYMFDVVPSTSNPYLLRGRIWVNAADFGVQRIEGEPAKKHSALVRRVHFVHEFARFGEFWFPVYHRSETNLAVFGSAVLEIKYFNYSWESRKDTQ